jgi:hypothetical protein
MKHSRRRFLQTAGAAALLTGIGRPAWAGSTLPPLNEGPAPATGWPRHRLLRAKAENSLDARLLGKTVLAERPLASAAWSASAGAEARPTIGPDGRQSVGLASPMLNAEYLRKARAPNGSSDGGAGFLVEGDGANFWRLALSPAQDWRPFNRISFELFVRDTGLESYSFGIGLVDAAAPAQGPTGPLPFTFVHDLEAGRWNEIVWEFPEIPRSEVVEFALFQPLRGPEGRVEYELRGLMLQRVDAEKVEGWEVAAGRIAYNHVGYRPGATKLALVGGTDATTFDLLDARSGRVAATFAVTEEQTRIGRFQRLDFSAFRKPGRYRLRIGALESRSFAIDDDLWIGVVGKLLNFFYADRCGHGVPGLHGVCHADLRGEHRGVLKPLNGGWHDAGNGSQGSYRTAICTEGLLAMYERLAARPDQAELAARAREEACWGLDWLLRTRFGGGYRVTQIGFNIYTDGALGTFDDIVRPAEFDPFENLLFASVAADAARLLKTADPARSALALDAALDDYDATLRALPDAKPPRADRNAPAPFQQYAYGVLAAVALHRATGRTSFLEDATKFGERLLACQHREAIGALRIAGFFYEDESRRRPSHEVHTSFADAAPRALAALAAALPNDRRASAWRDAATLHARGFLAAGSEAAAPYRHLPNSVWRDDQFADYVEAALAGMRHFPKNIGYKYIPPIDEAKMRAGFQEEFDAALPLSPGVRLRTFPIPPDPVFHGATTIQLAQASGLLAVARCCGDSSLTDLAERQLDWVFGANPFSNCLMYGEGYDFPSQFQTVARNMVGAVPVGIDNRLDRPFWPTANHFTFKEMWVVPAGHLLKVLAPLVGTSGPAERTRKGKEKA